MILYTCVFCGKETEATAEDVASARAKFLREEHCEAPSDALAVRYHGRDVCPTCLLKARQAAQQGLLFTTRGSPV